MSDMLELRLAGAASKAAHSSQPLLAPCPPIPNFLARPHGSDVPLKEYIRSLDEAAPAGDKFIIAELDDNNLFVKVAKAPFVQTKVKEFINSLHYTKPEVPMAGQA